MSDIQICKCGSIMHFDSYFKAYVCRSCGKMDRIKERKTVESGDNASETEVVEMTEQKLKECIAEVKYSDISKLSKKKIMNVLYEKLHKNKWILCSERMPEKGETVIACTLNGTFAGQYHEEGWYRENMFFYDSEILVGDVIAWQPLPEPYK